MASFSRENNPGVRLNMRYMIPLVFQLYHTTWMTFFKNSDFMTRFPLSFSFCCQHHLIDRSIPNQSRVTVVRPFFSRLFFFSVYRKSLVTTNFFFSLSLFLSLTMLMLISRSEPRTYRIQNNRVTIMVFFYLLVERGWSSPGGYILCTPLSDDLVMLL